MTITLEKTYIPSNVETRIYEAWLKANAFKSMRAGREKAEPYAIMIPPPNVTGSLHMGHALNNTLQDVLCRFERMRGKDVLWQVGTDHAGIATQMVVERKLAAEGKPTRQQMGKDAFLKEVWDWKAESGGTIIGQLKRLGASCDWERERFTMGERGNSDDQMMHAVTKVFVDLYKTNKIYRGKRLVNWDPHFQTAISDLEVVQVEKKGSFKWERGGEETLDLEKLKKILDKDPHGHMYYFDYPIVRDNKQEEVIGYIQVGTTRPETMLGDTCVAVHPENEKLSQWISTTENKYKVHLPLVDRIFIPIIGDEYADPEKGTGAVKITPAHDFNDYSVGERHAGIIIDRNILQPNGKIIKTMFDGFSYKYGEDPTHPEGSQLADSSLGISAEDFIPEDLRGLDRYDARFEVVKQMHELCNFKDRPQGLLAKIEPITHTVPHGDRSNVAIEPYLTPQWYADAPFLAKEALAAVKDGRTEFVPKNWEKTYFEWLENIQPWCISRQLWWGHQIPVWYLFDGTHFSAESREEAAAQAIDYCKLQISQSNLRHETKNAKKYQLIIDHLTNGTRPNVLKREDDVLDTWFSSALWPFSTLGWPEETAHLDKFYPTNVLVTGFDIIFFWVARMMMMGLHFKKQIPFHTIYIHALVRDAKGQKMSKSKGNVIDPLEIIDQYGADALRFTLAAMAAQGRDIKLDTSRVEGYRNFATKLWNATRFAQMNEAMRVEGFDPSTVKHPLNQWIIGETERCNLEVTRAIEEYKFNEAAGALYKFIWNIVCDWHVELIKPILSDEAHPALAETRNTLAWVLDHAYVLLHPFMPFITEELWGLTAKRGEILCLTPWPALNGLQKTTVDEDVDWLIELISQLRTLKADLRIEPKAKIDLVIIGAGESTRTRVANFEEALLRLGRINGISFADATPKGAAQFVQGEATIAVPLAGLLDFDAEKIRLQKDIDKLTGDIARIEAKLNNPDFIARAPEEVVEEQQENLAMNSEKAQKLKLALQALG